MSTCTGKEVVSIPGCAISDSVQFWKTWPKTKKIAEAWIYNFVGLSTIFQELDCIRDGTNEDA